MSLRILLLTTDAYGGHGGIALYNRDIVEALAQMEQVSEVVVVPRTMPHATGVIPEKVTLLTEAARGKIRFVVSAVGAARQHYDLVICGHINLLPLAVFLNLVIRAPLALMVYGIDVWRPRSAFVKKWVKRVDAVWSISDITRSRMNAWAELSANRYAILPNAVHLQRYGIAEKRPELLLRYGLQGSKVIMTLARLVASERYKGVDEVLETMPALLGSEPKLKYLIAGDGDDRARLLAKAHALGLADKVVFAGMVSEAEKANTFRLADAFVMPGTGEGFGFVFLEALACGIPVVGSQVDGSREALRGGLLGELVVPSSPASVRGGILRALAKQRNIPEGLEFFAWPQFCVRLSRAVGEIVR